MTHTHTAHTLGPWSIAPSFAGQWIKAGNSYICPLPDHIEHEGQPCGSVASQDKTQAEINANARLIAAAPELLAALIAIKTQAEFSATTFPNAPGRGDFLAIARWAGEAIAKAEGKA